MTIHQQLCAFVCMSLIAPLAYGHGGGGDIAVFETNNQVDVGFAVLDDNDINQISFDPNDSVFQAILTESQATSGPFAGLMLSSEPGYDANEGDLPGNANVTWNVLSLTYWDGSGTPTFTPAVGVDARYIPGTWNVPTGPQGGFHAHTDFALEETISGGRQDGVYVAELSISVDTLADSDSFFLVTLIDSDINATADPVTTAENLGAAVRQYLEDPSGGEPMLGLRSFAFYADAIAAIEASVVPEPTAASLLMAGLLALGYRRR